MRRTTLALVLAAAALAGCALPGSPDESRDGVEPDPQPPFTGPGVALVFRNEGPHPVTARWAIADAGSDSAGSASVLVPPGKEAQRKLPLPYAGRFDIRFQYNWTAEGRASAGVDSQAILSTDCPRLTRLGWELQESPSGGTAAAYKGKSCVA